MARLYTLAFIAILDCVRGICRGAQLCAPTDLVFYPIEKRY
ncbi:hypothetical protein [Scytonema millei]|nr:hypothetical protein [Scytonema millei]